MGKLANFSFFAAALAMGTAFVGCGDDTTVNENTALDMVASGEDMDKCTDKNDGAMVYVADSEAVYYCADGKWQTLNGKDGADGKDGEKGDAGKDGKSTIDTIVKLDTIYFIDTLVLNKVDTLVLNHVDTIIANDTIHSYDTLVVTSKIPSVLYDCEKYDCVTTAYLNPSIEYGELLDTRDNKVYRTVQIGNQTWMAQNLDYYDDSEISLQGQSWCYYDSLAFCETFGHLYSWAATMNISSTYNTTLTATGMIGEQHLGICPEGYHVPTSAEWDTLAAYVDAHNGGESVGTSLKSRYQWQARDSVSQGTDLFGWAGLPGDDRVDGQKSTKTGKTAGYDDVVFRAGVWWSATEVAASTASRWGMSFKYEALIVDTVSKTAGASVRCLKDSD